MASQKCVARVCCRFQQVSISREDLDTTKSKETTSEIANGIKCDEIYFSLHVMEYREQRSETEKYEFGDFHFVCFFFIKWIRRRLLSVLPFIKSKSQVRGFKYTRQLHQKVPYESRTDFCVACV